MKNNQLHQVTNESGKWVKSVRWEQGQPYQGFVHPCNKAVRTRKQMSTEDHAKHPSRHLGTLWQTNVLPASACMWILKRRAMLPEAQDRGPAGTKLKRLFSTVMCVWVTIQGASQTTETGTGRTLDLKGPLWRARQVGGEDTGVFLISLSIILGSKAGSGPTNHADARL